MEDSVAAKSKLPTKMFFISSSCLSIVRLASADLDLGQVGAGLSKGSFSIAGHYQRTPGLTCLSQGAPFAPRGQAGLFECISMALLSGSPEGYNAETGLCEPAQKPQSGEPNEHQTLYRIRRSQEKHQLLRQDRRRQDHRGRQTAGYAPGAAGVGAEAHGTLARRDGSDAVQQLDLRRAETLCRRARNGEPLDDESHRRGQEEERQTGCPEDRRPGALQSALVQGREGH